VLPSAHPWLADRQLLDLITTLDDATERSIRPFWSRKEGAASTFRGLGKVIEPKGLCYRFLHRLRHPYFYTPKAGVRSTGCRRFRSARLSPSAASSTLAGIVIAEAATQYLRAE
jgi:hypothetical protein